MAGRAAIATGLPYLSQTWRGQHWTLYSVRAPAPIAALPATTMAYSPAALWLWIPRAGTVLVRVESSPYLVVTAGQPETRAPTLSSRGPYEVAVTVPGAGQYRLAGSAGFSQIWKALVR